MDIRRDPSSHAPAPLQEPAIRGIVQDHGQFVWRALRHLGVRESDVEDACQDVFLVAHRRLADFRGDSTLRTWVYGICVRVASEHRRRAHVRREVLDSEPPMVAQPAEQVDQVERRESVELLARILDRVDDDKRAVFVLYEIEELTMKEVAQAVGCPLQTAYSRLHAARRLVSEAIAEYEAGGQHDR
jgi:RNA polymerase sigma-70 factor (ECF subfamily)